MKAFRKIFYGKGARNSKEFFWFCVIEKYLKITRNTVGLTNKLLSGDASRNFEKYCLISFQQHCVSQAAWNSRVSHFLSHKKENYSSHRMADAKCFFAILTISAHLTGYYFTVKQWVPTKHSTYKKF